MSTFIVTAVYLLSGAIIAYCLQKLGFTVAKNAFLVTFGLISILIPFVLGGELVMKAIMSGFFHDDPELAQLFSTFMMRNLNTGISVFNAAASIIAVSSLIVFVAFVIVSIYAAIRIVRFIRKIGSSARKKFAHEAYSGIFHTDRYIYRQKVYLRFCRLLN